MIENSVYSIAFAIVWTILQGVLVLLGVKDYSLLELVLYCVVMAITCLLVLDLTVLLVALINKIRAKINGWKTVRRVERLDLSEGETLDKHAEILGIQRAPEETDDDLRYRCIQKMILDEIQKEFQRK